MQPEPGFDIMDGLIDGGQEKKYDSNILSFYGTDQKNNFIFIKINNRKNKHTEVVLFLGLEDGRVYELPNHPNTVVRSEGNSSWSAEGLKISILEPAIRTRIIFNGLLRKGKCTDFNTDNDIEHVRFNCIFIASVQPYSRERFWSSTLQAETLARNTRKEAKWQKLINKLDINEIDQYGSIVGQVMFEDSSNIELYLRCLRQCQWGKCDATQYEKNICITGFDALGRTFHLNSGDVKDGLKNLQVGHLKTATDDFNPMDSMNFNNNEFLDRFENSFNELAFQFTAANNKYNVIIKLRRKSLKTLYGGYPWDSQYIYCNIELMLNNTKGAGLIQLWQPYSGSCAIKLSPIERFVKAKDIDENTQEYTLSFQDKRCQCENLVGGKGASLAELSSIQTTRFTVPEGFCITAHALESHIKYHATLSEAIDEFVKVCNGEKAGNVKNDCESIVRLMENTPVLHTVQSQILAALKQLESENEKSAYAVRSSAVGEDSEDTSAAGQNTTYLGIKETDEVIRYVAHCWASLYAYRSVEYRRQHGMAVKASMGVCVQKMVPADAAGVMFSRHPQTGNPKEILIASNYGLGESVVAAVVDPDTITIDRSSDGTLSIKNSTIGKKTEKIIVSADGGTVSHNLSSQESSKLSVSPDIALKLAEVGVLLDQLYNAPRDVEWAVSGERIYLLQCRPVTALEAWTDFELIHELGSGVVCETDVLAFSNVGEVLPMVITPLTMSTIMRSLNVSAEINIINKPILHTYKSHMFIVNMRCTLHVLNLFLRFVEKEITLGNKVTDLAICGRPIVTPEIHELAKMRNGVLTDSQRLNLFKDMIANMYKNSKVVEAAQKILQRCRESPVVKRLNEFTDSKQLHAAIGLMVDEFTRVSSSHSSTSKCSIFYQVILMATLAEGSDFTPEHYSDIALLLGSCSDVISAQVPIVLRGITNTIKESGMSEQFKNVDLSEAMNWLLINCPKAYEQVQGFIKDHGYRGIEEFDLITETWNMKPEKFLSTIQSLISSNSEDNGTGSKDLSPSETIAQLKSPRKRATRWILRCLLPFSRKAVAQREETKSLLIELVHHIRLAYRKLATLLVREGRLPDQDLVFFFTHQELAELIGGANPSLVRKAARRKRLRPQLQKHKYREVNFGMPKPIEQANLADMSGSGIKLQGTAVCNGVVTGRACVALTLEEAADIKPGDILITNATDIGWSPYFPLLGGVVTELGGLISHGAVIAREYGLPCIISAENATRIFRTGEIVKLDGFTGIIQTVKEAS